MMHQTNDGLARAKLTLAMKGGFITAGLALLAIATLLHGLSAVLAVMVAAALMASAFLGMPERLADYVRARRGAGYQRFFSVATPLGLCLLFGFAGWLELDVVRLLGVFSWTDLGGPAFYFAAAAVNTAVLIANLRSPRAGR